MATPLEAIADPVRLSIVRALSERGPASLEELAASAKAHLNTVRHHLRELEAAGLVLRAEAPARGPGRPRRSYRLREGWTLPTGDFRKIAEILAGCLLKNRGALRDLEQFGANWGRYLAGRPGNRDGLKELVGVLDQLGYSARIQGTQLSLSGCPCPLVAPDNPALLCSLLTAVARGFLEAAANGVELRESRHDPDRRVCSLHLKRAAP